MAQITLHRAEIIALVDLTPDEQWTLQIRAGRWLGLTEPDPWGDIVVETDLIACRLMSANDGVEWIEEGSNESTGEKTMVVGLESGTILTIGTAGHLGRTTEA